MCQILLLKISFSSFGYRFTEEAELHLIQISFDGNNIVNPPSLMDGEIFGKINKAQTWNFTSFINIIYRDDFIFLPCDVNSSAAERLRELSKTM